MGYLSFFRDERLYLVAFGVTAIGFVASVRTILEYYRDQCEVKPQEPKTQYITQDTEDSLKSSTLASLLDHYNYSIRETALKIVAGRAANDAATIDELLWGITLKDYDERAMYLKALVWAIEDSESGKCAHCAVFFRSQLTSRRCIPGPAECAQHAKGL